MNIMINKKCIIAILLTAVLLMPASAQISRTYSRSANVAEATDSSISLWPATGAAYMGLRHVISFGNFKTSRVHASTNETVVMSVSLNRGAKFRFKQLLGDMAIKVKARQDLNIDDIAKFVKVIGNHNNLDKGLDYTATIDDPVEGVWTMAMNTSFSDEDFDCGFIYHENTDMQYLIRGRNYSNSLDVMLMRANFYYNIYDGDTLVASVNSDGKGWAWIDTTLTPERQIVLAAAISSMLMLKWNVN